MQRTCPKRRHPRRSRLRGGLRRKSRLPDRSQKQLEAEKGSPKFPESRLIYESKARGRPSLTGGVIRCDPVCIRRFCGSACCDEFPTFSRHGTGFLGRENVGNSLRSEEHT